MPHANRHRRIAAALAAAALSAGVPAAPRADAGAVPADRMRLAPGAGGILGVEGGAVPEHLGAEGGAWLGYASDLLVLAPRSDGARGGSIVGSRLGGGVWAAVGLLGRWQLGIEVPVVLWQDRDPDATTSALPEAAAFGVGSARIVPKVALLSAARHHVEVAALAAFTLPLGAAGFVGSEPSLQPELAASRSLGPVRLAANAGLLLRERQRLLGVDLGNELTARLGAAVRLDGRGGVPLEAGVALAAATALSRPLAEEDERSLELQGFATWGPARSVRAFAGAGRGLTRGWGTPVWRLFAGVRLAWPERAAAAPGPGAAARR